MKEKLIKSLHSLGFKIDKVRTAAGSKCEKGWNAFCKAVCDGIRLICRPLRRACRSIRSFRSRCREAYRSSRFAAALNDLLVKIRTSRPVTAVSDKFGELREKLRQKSSPQSPEANAPTDQTEESQELTTEAIENELRRERFRHRYGRLLRSTVYALIVTAAAAALVATLLLPVLQIYGSSMTPTLHEGDIVVSVKANTYDYGDICSFYYSNRILVKRVIGKPLDRIDIDDDGNVYVNGQLLDEPYINEKAKGECDIEFPYRVPEGSYFMIGDHRLTSIDSRSSTVGCISRDEIVGKILFTVWPPKHMGVKK